MQQFFFVFVLIQKMYMLADSDCSSAPSILFLNLLHIHDSVQLSNGL